MANASGKGSDCDEEEVFTEVVVSVEEDMQSILLDIIKSVPNPWPSGLNNRKKEFLPTCIAGVDFEPSTLVQSTTITPQLRDQAAWRTVGPYQMEMCVNKHGK